MHDRTAKQPKDNPKDNPKREGVGRALRTLARGLSGALSPSAAMDALTDGTPSRACYVHLEGVCPAQAPVNTEIHIISAPPLSMPSPTGLQMAERQMASTCPPCMLTRMSPASMRRLDKAPMAGGILLDILNIFFRNHQQFPQNQLHFDLNNKN